MAYFLIIAAAAARLLPHEPNFVPIAAIALFSTVYLKQKWAFFVALAAMFVSDLFIGFYNPYLMLAVYGSFALVATIGYWLKNNKTVANIFGASLIGSIIFFVITNFVMWAVQFQFPTPMYSPNLSGLIECYVMALPFFRNSIAGDLFYTGVMFGAMEAVNYYEFKKTATKRLAI